jgi:hypothetical protein
MNVFQAPQGRNERGITGIQRPVVSPLQGFNASLESKP